MWERIRLRRLEHKTLKYFSLWKNLSLLMCIMPIAAVSLVLSSLIACLSKRLESESAQSNAISSPPMLNMESKSIEEYAPLLICSLTIVLVTLFIVYCLISKGKSNNPQTQSSGEGKSSWERLRLSLKIAMLIVSVMALFIMLLQLYASFYMVLGLHVLVGVIFVLAICLVVGFFFPSWFLRNEGIKEKDVSLLREATFKPLTPLSILVSILLITLSYVL